jgi:hypothetical protein
MLMAIAVVSTINGPAATAANYDDLIRKLGCFPGGRHPDAGCLFHWVEAKPNELRVTDVWKTEAHWNVYLQNILIPTSAGGPLPAPNSFTVHIHNYLTAGGLDPL